MKRCARFLCALLFQCLCLCYRSKYLGIRIILPRFRDTMPFKIVKTIEKGKSLLITVPSSWENDGSLYWPNLPSKKIDKLRRFENFEPEEDWKIINCVLKRNNLNTFENAELEIENMCFNSDTETDNEKENRSVKKKSQKLVNFEKIVEECLISTDTNSFMSDVSSSIVKANQTFTPTPNPLMMTHQEASLLEEPQIVTIAQEPHVASIMEGTQDFGTKDLQINKGLIIDDTFATQIDNLISKVNTIQENQVILQENINIILENQKLCYDGQQLMMLNLSQTLTQFEMYMNKSTKKTENVDFQIIRDIEGLQHLENLLEFSEKKSVIKQKLSAVCGKGKGRGINNAYALIDVMFDRSFLKSCSWAGGSRTTDAKVCFKSFTKVIKLFFDIIFDSDNCFTMNECHTFFKNVLKNSSQRCKSKNLRTSTTKHRPKIKENKTLTKALADKDKRNENIPAGPDETGVDESEVEKSNKIISSRGLGPILNARLPLNEISVDAEVHVKALDLNNM